MFRFLLAVLVLDAIVLATAVLLQAGKGGGLAASFGGAGSSPSSLLGSREAGNLLTKASWTCGGIFIGLAFILQLMSSSSSRQVRSVLDENVSTRPAPASTPVPGTGTAPANSPLQPIAPPAGAKQPPPSGKQPPAGKQP